MSGIFRSFRIRFVGLPHFCLTPSLLCGRFYSCETGTSPELPVEQEEEEEEERLMHSHPNVYSSRQDMWYRQLSDGSI